MIRAFRLDMATMRRARLSNFIVMVALCVAVGFVSKMLPLVFVAAVFMRYPLSVLSLDMVDETGTWGAYRLSLPVSRRDCVFGRYLSALAMIGMGLASGFVAMPILLAASSLASLVGGSSTFDGLPSLPDGFISPSALLASLLAVCATLFAGTLMFGVVTPLYYRYGMTKVTLMLPSITVGAVVLAVVVAGGQPDWLASWMPGLFMWIQSSAHMALTSLAMLMAAAVVFAVSAVVSARLYERREL